jgi:hypothetical protein
MNHDKHANEARPLEQAAGEWERASYATERVASLSTKVTHALSVARASIDVSNIRSSKKAREHWAYVERLLVEANSAHAELRQQNDAMRAALSAALPVLEREDKRLEPFGKSVLREVNLARSALGIN